MKRVLTIVIILFAWTASAFPQTETLTILYLNDTHSVLAPIGPRNADLSGTRGGIARAASVIGSYELSGANVLTLHGGDFSVGDLFYNVFYGVPELQILNSLGVDAMAAGNHEFDLGPSTLDGVLTAAFGNPGTGFPILSANADLSAYPGTLSTFIKPYMVKSFGDLKVGIFGLTTHETNFLSNPSPVIIDDNFISIAAATVQTLISTEQCDFIICLSHYGLLGDKALAYYVPGIDLIVGSHDHIPYAPFQIGDTWLVQGEAFYSAIGTINFEITPGSITMTGYANIKLDSSIPENPDVMAAVNTLIPQIESLYGPVYSQQIGNSNSFMEEFAYDIVKPGNHSTPAGNFITDAMIWKTGTDFAIEPGGSIAQPLYKGAIVPADLFRMVGYGFNTQNGLGFRIITASISGYELYKGLEILLANLENEDYFPQFSGINLKYMPDAPQGERITSVKINKMNLNPVQMYTFTSNELVLMMLDVLGIQYENPQIMDYYTEFQNLYEYTLFLKGDIKSNSQARITGVGGPGNAHKDAYGASEKEYSIQNYPNPFNPSTIIKFTLPYDGTAKLTVYNITGEQTAVLIEGFIPAGEYEVEWRGDSFPAGVYFYNLTTADYTQTGKMLLLK